MKILVLIISSDNLPIYKFNKEVWRSYMNMFSNIDCYFIEYTNESDTTNKNTPYIENNTIYFKGEESFPNIIHKTLNSLEYFINDTYSIKYDFVVRTNLSSVWDFKTLQIYLDELPTKNNIYSGPRGPYYNLETYQFWFYFVGGMGIVMSRDVCELLLKPENRTMAENFKNMDDIDIGYVMYKCGIPILPLNYCDVNSMEHFHEKEMLMKEREYLFYRVKTNNENRDNEFERMLNVVSTLYNS